jgi:hypothetical protein
MPYDGDARLAPSHLSGGRLDADATTLADVSSGFGLGDGGGGGGVGSLRALASSIPVDPQVSASLTDDALGAADRMGDHLRDIKMNNQNWGYYANGGGDGGEGTERWGNAPLAGGGEGGSGLGAADVWGGEAAAAAVVVPDPSQSSFIPVVDDGLLADSILSRQLSDLDLDSLQRDGGDALTGGFAAADPVSSPMPHAGGSLGDSFRDQLDRLNLPRYHIEMPTMANPFSGAASPPAMEDALSSIKAASVASEERLGSLLDTIARSFEDLSERVADASTSFEGLPGRMAEVGNAGASGVGAPADALRGGASKVAAFRPPSFDIETSNFDAPKLPQVHVDMPTLPNLSIIDGTSAAVRRIGDASLVDFGNAVLSTIKFTGGIVVKFLDFILNAVSGTSVASILANAQISVTTAMDSASHAVVGTLTEFGNMSVIEIVQHVMKLVIVVTDILLKITNAVLYVISGKDGAAWALQATSSIDGASTQLLARAEDFTHASLAELTHSIGDYGQLVGGEFVTLIASVRSAVDGVSLSSVSLPDNVLDNVASAVQTAFSL